MESLLIKESKKWQPVVLKLALLNYYENIKLNATISIQYDHIHKICVKGVSSHKLQKKYSGDDRKSLLFRTPFPKNTSEGLLSDDFIPKIPVGIYLLKVNNKNFRTRCEICSKLTIKTPERRQWRRFGVFIVDFEHISHLVLVFLLLTLSR